MEVRGLKCGIFNLRATICFVVTFLLTIRLGSTIDLTVTTSVGNITGSTKSVDVGPQTLQVAAFLGIPYAEPPLGQLRFAKPVPKAPFNDTFVAKSFGPVCPQAVVYPNQIRFPNQDEDCLNLNVFSPRLTGSGPKYPVMIWIHGGSFLFGSGSGSSSDILSAFGQVVVVSINYRLGPFGFLDSGDTSAEGNLGLWDQHMAIQWVKYNIAAFGGDDSKITIFGESSGASSVTYQALYPGNEGLIQRMLAQSGALNVMWSLKRDPVTTFHQYAARMNCSRATSGEIVACLRSVTDVMTMIEKSTMTYTTGGIDWAPTIDGDFVTQQRLDALNHPIGKNRLAHFQKLDLLIGTNGFEGVGSASFYSRYTSVLTNASSTMDEVRQTFKDILFSGVESLLGAKRAKKVFPDVHFLYDNLEDPQDRNGYIVNLGDAFTDLEFFISTYSTLGNHVTNNNQSATYQYEFNELSPFRQHNSWVSGALHADDLKYVFGSVYKQAASLSEKKREEQWALSKTIMSYWTNFAKTGNPNQPTSVNVNWEKYDVTNKKYLYLTSAEIKVKNNLYNRRAEFWTSYLPSLIERYSEKNTVVTSGPCTNSASSNKFNLLVLMASLSLFVFNIN